MEFHNCDTRRSGIRSMKGEIRKDLFEYFGRENRRC